MHAPFLFSAGDAGLLPIALNAPRSNPLCDGTYARPSFAASSFSYAVQTGVEEGLARMAPAGFNRMMRSSPAVCNCAASFGTDHGTCKGVWNAPKVRHCNDVVAAEVWSLRMLSACESWFTSGVAGSAA